MAFTLASAQQPDFVLVLSLKGAPAGDHHALLHAWCKRHQLVGTRASDRDGEGARQLRYVVALKKGNRPEALIEALHIMDGVKQVSLEVEVK
jgi:hypothetical protein